MPKRLHQIKKKYNIFTTKMFLLLKISRESGLLDPTPGYNFVYIIHPVIQYYIPKYNQNTISSVRL